MKSQYLLVSLLMVIALCTGCSEDDSMTEIVSSQKEEQNTDDEVIQALKTIPEISNIKIG